MVVIVKVSENARELWYGCVCLKYRKYREAQGKRVRGGTRAGGYADARRFTRDASILSK